MGWLDNMINGLGTDSGQFGAALWAAAAPKPGPRNPGEALMQAFQAMQGNRDARAQRQERSEDREMRRRQIAMQEQQQQLALQQAQEQAARQQTDAAALRGLFAPLPGPTQDGSQLRRGLDIPGMLQSGASPQAVQTAAQLDAMVNPRQKEPQFKVVGNALVRIGGDGVTSEAYRAPEKPASLPSAVQEYQFAVSQGYNKPFQQWVTEKARAGAASTTVSLGSPVPVTLPDGTQAFVQPSNRPGQPPQIMRLPGAQDPLRPPPKDKALTESQAKAAAFSSQMRAAEGELSGVPIDPTKLWSQIDVKMAGGPTNLVASGPAQRARQAQEQWAEAFLRFKTGAASTKDEVMRNVQTYFPQPGDGADVIAQKARMRQQAMRDVGMAAGAGGASQTQQPTPAGQPSLDDLLKKYGG